MKSGQGVIYLVGLGVSLGLLVAWVSLSLHFGTRADTVANLSAILSGGPLTFNGAQRSDLPGYNRVLFAGLHHLLVLYAPFFSGSQWYAILRILTCQAMFVAFALVCRHCFRLGRREVAFASSMLAIATIATFGWPWEEPADVVDMLGFILGVAAVLSGRFWVCLILATVFAFNRESAAFLGVVWFVLSPRPRLTVRRCLEATALCGAAYGAALLIRHLIKPSVAANWLTLRDNLESLWLGVAQFNILHPLPILAATVFLLALNIRMRDRLARDFVALAGIFFGFAMLFGTITELRVHLPSLLMLVFAIAASVRAGNFIIGGGVAESETNRV